MFTNNIYLLQFKCQGHLHKRGLRMPVHQNSFRIIKKSKICTYSVAILLFSQQNSLTSLPSSEVCSLIFVEKTIKRLSKLFLLAKTTQNLESINVKHVFCLFVCLFFCNTTHLGFIKQPSC